MRMRTGYLLLGLAAVAPLAGCTNPYDPGQRALGGAAIGAGGGALIGGAMGGGSGAVAGALIGGAAGAVTGVATTPEQPRYYRRPPPPPPGYYRY